LIIKNPASIAGFFLILRPYHLHFNTLSEHRFASDWFQKDHPAIEVTWHRDIGTAFDPLDTGCQNKGRNLIRTLNGRQFSFQRFACDPEPLFKEKPVSDMKLDGLGNDNNIVRAGGKTNATKQV